MATDSGRLQQAMACTAQLAHMSYRIGPDGTLLASPLPDTLRGGLLMLSDEGGTYPDAPEGLCRQLVQECLRRRYAGVVLDAMPPEGFCRTLDELLARQERQLYLPEAAAGYAPHGTAPSAPPLPPAAWRIGWPQPPKNGGRSAWPWICSG